MKSRVAAKTGKVRSLIEKFRDLTVCRQRCDNRRRVVPIGIREEESDVRRLVVRVGNGQTGVDRSIYLGVYTTRSNQWRRGDTGLTDQETVGRVANNLDAGWRRASRRRLYRGIPDAQIAAAIRN